MNKIPFTSQNPYAFYAKTMESYDTETNTRKANKKKKTQSFKKFFFFLFLLSTYGEHLLK